MTQQPIDAMTTGPAYERNAAAMLLDRTRRSRQRTALVVPGHSELTYGQLGERIARIVAELRANGVGRGDRVAFGAANRTEVVEYMVATLSLGAIFVPLNTRLSAPELRFVLEDAGVTVVVADTAAAGLVDRDRPDLGGLALLHLGPDPTPGGWLPVGDTDDTGADTRDGIDLADTGAGIDLAETDDDDVAVLMYTSGTTGVAKGVMITHGNLAATVHNLMLLIPLGADAGMLAMAPIFHVGAMALVLGALATGGRVVILPQFDPAAVFDALESQPITFSFGVPAMLQMMAAEPRFEQADLSGVLLMCAGAPVPESLLHRYLDRGAKVTQGYGLTESTAVVSLLESDDAARKLGSAGMPYPLTAVELRTPDGGRIDEAGVDGEIWIKGRNVVAGYWNRPDETAALRDEHGWLRTGDAGRFDADGYLYITDRVKDMVISGGENVYPAEVEKVLSAHPAVADVAVIGLPDERWGEVVTAVVVPKPGHDIDLDDVQEFVRNHLGGYKVPRRLHLADELPRNATGKVLKRSLRDELADR